VPARFLPIYLNDHLAGATLGVELARRTLRENEGNEYADFLRGLLHEIAADLETLVDLMRRLDVPRSPVRRLGGWGAEKLGRLKPNGQLTGYTPLARLLELEGLAAGINAKHALWLSLLELQDRDERLREEELRTLVDRAEAQRDGLEPFRLRAARDAFGE
jgi:hypothetical protein